MSHHDHEEHHDDHHEVGPCQATEIVPEKSAEDYGLYSMVIVCCVFLMITMGRWMMIEQPSGGGDHGHAQEHKSGAGAETHGQGGHH